MRRSRVIYYHKSPLKKSKVKLAPQLRVSKKTATPVFDIQRINSYHNRQPRLPCVRHYPSKKSPKGAARQKHNKCATPPIGCEVFYEDNVLAKVA
jgi:hypothetical protein